MTDDERAARQRAIAAAIRRVSNNARADACAEILLDVNSGASPGVEVAALAAACLDGELWDAMAQVRQAVVLEGQDVPAARAREHAAPRPATRHDRAMTERRLSEGTTVYLHAATGAPYALRVGPERFMGDRPSAEVLRTCADDVFTECGYACVVGPFVAELGVYVLLAVTKLRVDDVVLAFAYTEGKPR